RCVARATGDQGCGPRFGLHGRSRELRVAELPGEEAQTPTSRFPSSSSRTTSTSERRNGDEESARIGLGLLDTIALERNFQKEGERSMAKKKKATKKAAKKAGKKKAAKKATKKAGKKAGKKKAAKR